MYKKITLEEFIDTFVNSQYKDNFSISGLVTLFNYFEQEEEIEGTEKEFDIVSIVCTFKEFISATEGACEYFEFEGMIYDKDGGETETAEEVEAKALKFLEDRTLVLEIFDGACYKTGGVIIDNNF